jgi:hypothetical protein
MARAVIMLMDVGHAAHAPRSGGLLDYVWLLVPIGFAVSCVWLAWWSSRRFTGGAEDWNDGDSGGGGWGRGPRPKTPPPNSDPEWWPEFERQFAVYLQGHRAQPAQPCSTGAFAGGH